MYSAETLQIAIFLAASGGWIVGVVVGISLPTPAGG